MAFLIIRVKSVGCIIQLATGIESDIFSLPTVPIDRMADRGIRPSRSIRYMGSVPVATLIQVIKTGI